MDAIPDSGAGSPPRVPVEIPYETSIPQRHEMGGESVPWQSIDACDDGEGPSPPREKGGGPTRIDGDVRVGTAEPDGSRKYLLQRRSRPQGGIAANTVLADFSRFSSGKFCPLEHDSSAALLNLGEFGVLRQRTGPSWATPPIASASPGKGAGRQAFNPRCGWTPGVDPIPNRPQRRRLRSSWTGPRKAPPCGGHIQLRWPVGPRGWRTSPWLARPRP